MFFCFCFFGHCIAVLLRLTTSGYHFIFFYNIIWYRNLVKKHERQKLTNRGVKTKWISFLRPNLGGYHKICYWTKWYNKPLGELVKCDEKIQICRIIGYGLHASNWYTIVCMLLNNNRNEIWSTKQNNKMYFPFLNALSVFSNFFFSEILYLFNFLINVIVF
jgi:hypothetical protein